MYGLRELFLSKKLEAVFLCISRDHRLNMELDLQSLFRTRICKSLWSPGIDSEESISPAYVAWRASTTNRVSYRPARLRIDTWSP
jgi:hypothetical protein